jgi:hypothetical protein
VLAVYQVRRPRKRKARAVGSESQKDRKTNTNERWAGNREGIVTSTTLHHSLGGFSSILDRFWSYL